MASLGKTFIYASLKAEGLSPTEEYTYGNVVHRYWVNEHGEYFAVPDEEHCCDSVVFANILSAVKEAK